MCDDVCLAELTEQVLADTAWSSFRDLRPLATALGADRPVDPIVPAQEGQWDAWSTVEVRDGGPWFLSQPPEGVWGAFRVWNTEGGREVPVDSRVCLASAGGGRLVTSEGPGCSQVHVRSLPALELVESRELGFSIVGLWAAPDGWLAVGEDGAAAWVMSGKTWTGVLNPYDPDRTGPAGDALYDGTKLLAPDGAALRVPDLDSCRAVWGGLACGEAFFTTAPTVEQARAPRRSPRTPPPDPVTPDPTTTRTVVLHGEPGAHVQLWRYDPLELGGQPVPVRREVLDALGQLELGLPAGSSWGASPVGTRPAVRIPPATQTLHAEVSGADDSLDVQARCRVRGRWGHIVWRGRCEDRVARLRDRPMVLGAGTMRRWRVIDEYRTRPYVDVPAVASGRWFIRSWDPIDDEVDGSDWLGPVLDGVRVTADAQHAVHLSNGGEPELCLTVTPRWAGGTDRSAPGPCREALEHQTFVDVSGRPTTVTVTLLDGREKVVTGEAELPVEGWGVRGSVRDRDGATVWWRPPPVSLPPVTLDGEWVQLETGDRYLVRDDVVQRGSSGDAPEAVFVDERWPNGAWLTDRLLLAETDTTAIEVDMHSMRVLSLWHRRPEAHAPPGSADTRVACAQGVVDACRTALESAGPAIAAAAWAHGRLGLPLEDLRSLMLGSLGRPPETPTVPGGLAWQTVGPRGTPVAVALGGPANASVTSSPDGQAMVAGGLVGSPMPGLWVERHGRLVDLRPRLERPPLEAPLEGWWWASDGSRATVSADAITFSGSYFLSPETEQRLMGAKSVRQHPRVWSGTGVSVTDDGVFVLASDDLALWVGDRSVDLLVRQVTP